MTTSSQSMCPFHAQFSRPCFSLNHCRRMAERRAVSWMKAVTLMFWLQCRMPIFIYGCFEDTHAQLQGAT